MPLATKRECVLSSGVQWNLVRNRISVDLTQFTIRYLLLSLFTVRDKKIRPRISGAKTVPPMATDLKMGY